MSSRRSPDDEGDLVDSSSQLYDNTKVSGPGDLRDWLATSYGPQFTIVATEKLLIYALGRGVEAGDMPLVRAIARDVIRNNGRFSSIVLGIVKSQPFQMNMRTGAQPGTTTARANFDQTGAN